MADDDIEYVYSDDDALPESPSRRTAAPAPAPASSVRSGVDYRRLAPEEIKAEQGKVIREVATVLEVPPECAHTLLIVFKQVRASAFERPCCCDGPYLAMSNLQVE